MARKKSAPKSARKNVRTRKPPADAQLALRLPQALLERLDQWRLEQIGPPSRNGAVRWVIEQYLDQIEKRTETV